MNNIFYQSLIDLQKPIAENKKGRLISTQHREAVQPAFYKDKLFSLLSN